MYFKNKTVLVTGGTGSMGRTLVDRLLSGQQEMPEKIIVFSRDEGKQHTMQLSYFNAPEKLTRLEFNVGDLRNYDDVCRVVKHADIVINAGALKQVPTCEYFPHQAVLTNYMGPYNITRAIQEHDYPVETVIGISTDKACKPVSVMGMTKALQERIFIVGNISSPKTRFINVRFGNVLASRGSVIPVFHEQIQRGGPVTITDPHMTRFLLSLNEAVDLVFFALNEAKPGEIFMPITPSATVGNLAKALIGHRKIPTVIKGARPGEKPHETLVSEEEVRHCIKRGNCYVILPTLPELGAVLPKQTILKGEYSSADVVLNFDQTHTLLKRHNLLLKETASSDADSTLACSLP